MGTPRAVTHARVLWHVPAKTQGEPRPWFLSGEWVTTVASEQWPPMASYPRTVSRAGGGGCVLGLPAPLPSSPLQRRIPQHHCGRQRHVPRAKPGRALPGGITSEPAGAGVVLVGLPIGWAWTVVQMLRGQARRRGGHGMPLSWADSCFSV